jgi:SAM-dependent methyltransferase
MERINTETGYKLLAPIYRQIGEHRGYFIKEALLLEQIFDLEGVPRGSKILDAACGTGDVICKLYYRGFKVFASDGSYDMLAQWIKDAPKIPHERCYWAELNNIFAKYRNFDVIFMLCNSIAHASPDTIRYKLFKYVYSGLKKNGIFLFDIRPWERDATDKIEETGRKSDIERVLQMVNLPDGRYWLKDKVSYTKNRQIVEYTLSKSSNPKAKHKAKIGYYMFDWKEARKWLTDVGFRDIKVLKFQDWDYLVMFSRR